MDKTELISAIRDPNAQLVEQVQALWSDFGALVRCHSPKLEQNLIVKLVNPPKGEDYQHPRGWGTALGRQRKLKSYQVENLFYQNYAHRTNTVCRVPKLLLQVEQNQQLWLIMEDLAEAGYSEKREQGCVFTVQQVIRWLAHFHAVFMFEDGSDLWPQGGYWHLATRQDEWHKMPDSPLKARAQDLDGLLQQAQFKTLVHGDAKLQNMCFEPTQAQVAAVDFQYVGRGPGIVDFMYLLSSAFQQDALFEHHQGLLDYYLDCLQQALLDYSVPLSFAELEREYRQLYSVAWADFYRFLLGWNPDSWKVNDFISAISREAIATLQQETP